MPIPSGGQAYSAGQKTTIRFNKQAKTIKALKDECWLLQLNAGWVLHQPVKLKTNLYNKEGLTSYSFQNRPLGRINHRQEICIVNNPLIIPL
jgi:hypothetical protein